MQQTHDQITQLYQAAVQTTLVGDISIVDPISEERIIEMIAKAKRIEEEKQIITLVFNDSSIVQRKSLRTIELLRNLHEKTEKMHMILYEIINCYIDMHQAAPECLAKLAEFLVSSVNIRDTLGLCAKMIDDEFKNNYGMQRNQRSGETYEFILKKVEDVVEERKIYHDKYSQTLNVIVKTILYDTTVEQINLIINLLKLEDHSLQEDEEN